MGNKTTFSSLSIELKVQKNLPSIQIYVSSCKPKD